MELEKQNGMLLGGQSGLFAGAIIAALLAIIVSAHIALILLFVGWLIYVPLLLLLAYRVGKHFRTAGQLDPDSTSAWTSFVVSFIVAFLLAAGTVLAIGYSIQGCTFMCW